MLNADIQPSIELLRKQCSAYNEWSQLQSQLERLRRILIAFDYCECIKWVCYYVCTVWSHTYIVECMVCSSVWSQLERLRRILIADDYYACVKCMGWHCTCVTLYCRRGLAMLRQLL